MVRHSKQAIQPADAEIPFIEKGGEKHPERGRGDYMWHGAKKDPETNLALL